jgi:8-oxo-dGTP pyrophosphatase MutT (NUDIX family)
VPAFDQPRSRGHDVCKEVRQVDQDQGDDDMRFADKACPVVFRDASMRQILAFEHPAAGVQLVNGGIGPGENARAAALRELEAEAGISEAAIAQDLGTWHSGEPGDIWSLHLCTFSPQLPESWTHRADDDHGHEFKFFWHDVNSTTDEKWPPEYRRALEAIRERTRALRWRG